MYVYESKAKSIYILNTGWYIPGTSKGISGSAGGFGARRKKEKMLKCLKI